MWEFMIFIFNCLILNDMTSNVHRNDENKAQVPLESLRKIHYH